MSKSDVFHDFLFEFQGSLSLHEASKKAREIFPGILACREVALYIEREGRLSLWGSSSFEPITRNTFAGSAALSGAVLNLEGLSTDLRAKRFQKEVGCSEFDGMSVFPLMNDKAIEGVLVAISPENQDWTEKQKLCLKVFSKSLSVLRAFERSRTQFRQVCESLVNAVEHKDAYTGNHTRRVRFFSEMIGKEMGLTNEQLEELRLSAILHDIGKIGIEDYILKKPAPLSMDEFERMKEHPHMGYEILKNVVDFENIIDGVRYHHERPDGKGYPYGLKGDEIPLIASIIAVADTFDAMISHRPYRKGLSPMVAYREIKRFAGAQFDEIVVGAFERAFKKTGMYRPQEILKKTGS